MFVHPLLALALVGGVASSTKTRATTAPKKDAPNVVLLFADDLGFGDPGFAGHPSNLTPNLDALRASGRRLSTWYSGCPVCTGSRASLMTGRVYSRVGVPGVFGPTSQSGLPLREVTLADQFRTAGYATGMLGKWHLGQREAYLPASRGFDSYLGIPFSDDMGAARLSDCGNGTTIPATVTGDWSRAAYAAHGYTQALRFEDEASDRGGRFLPLVSQSKGATTVVEQPVDLTHLQEKYAAFATDFIGNAKKKFFFYAALSHVHTTQGNLPDKQYAGCAFRGTSIRGPFGDALAEADDLVGSIVGAAESAGSVGHLYARSAGYWNVGKGSTWEGIREPASYCVMKVRGEEQSTRVSSTFLDNNNPPFMEFYHFGCQPRDAAIDFQCFDWDRRQDHEVVFTGETLRAWPASNEQFRWDDRDEPKYHFNVVLAYDGDGDSATSSSSSKSTREGDLTIGIVGLLVAAPPRRALTPATRSRAAASEEPAAAGPEDGELDDLADLLDGEDDLSDLLGDDDDDDDDDAPAAPPPAGEVLLRMGEAGGDAASLEAEWQRRKEEMDSTAERKRARAEKRRRDVEEDERLAIEKGLGVLHKDPLCRGVVVAITCGTPADNATVAELTAALKGEFGPQVEVAHNVDPTPEDDMPLFEVWLEGYRYVVLHSRNWHEEGDLTPEKIGAIVDVVRDEISDDAMLVLGSYPDVEG
ncbi:sulfuric ester hydrolase [Aureococcus anophagefferens]|nr:sulfuric ester hydrolase [Aureococcus anophagefferens]